MRRARSPRVRREADRGQRSRRASGCARACADAGVTLMVGHAFRRLGAARRVKELLDDGALGRVVLAEANMSLPGSLQARGVASPSRAQPAAGRSCSSASTTWTRSRTGSARCARASGRFAHVHTACGHRRRGRRDARVRVRRAGIADGQLRVAEDAHRSACSAPTRCSTTAPTSRSGRTRGALDGGHDAHARRRAGRLRGARHARRGARRVRTLHPRRGGARDRRGRGHRRARRGARRRSRLTPRQSA